jgi:RND family efflux transporter MFP subunit
MERAVTVVGLLAADEAATVSTKIGGRLKSIPVDLGSVVRQGDLIAEVDPRDYELRLQQAAAALAQARANVGLALEGTDDGFDPETTSAVKQAQALLDEAARNRERIGSLSKGGVVSQSELDSVEALHLVALNRYVAAVEDAHTRQAILAQRRAELEMAQQQLADTRVRAPFEGAIQARLANLGEFLPAGAPVVKLVKTDPLRLRMEVPERAASVVRQGQAVRLTVEGDTNIYSGRITRLSPAIDEQARILLAEADVRNDGSLRPGLFTRAQIIIQEDDPALAVPASALILFAGLEKVVVIHNGKALEKVVTTGRRVMGWVEIVSGVSAGEMVVVEPGNLRSGEVVTVIDSGPPSTTGTSQEAAP